MMAKFVKISSYHLNLDNITSVDYPNNKIHFIDGRTLNLEPEYMQDFKKLINAQIKEGAQQ